MTKLRATSRREGSRPRSKNGRVWAGFVVASLAAAAGVAGLYWLDIARPSIPAAWMAEDLLALPSSRSKPIVVVRLTLPPVELKPKLVAANLVTPPPPAPVVSPRPEADAAVSGETEAPPGADDSDLRAKTDEPPAQDDAETETASPSPITAPEPESLVAALTPDNSGDGATTVAAVPEPEERQEVVVVAAPSKSAEPAPLPVPKPGSRKPSNIFGADEPSSFEVASGPASVEPSFSPKDVIGWSKLPWGSTKTELEGKYEDGLVAYENSTFELFDVDYYFEHVRFEDLQFDVVFQMSKAGKGLAQVLIDGNKRPGREDFLALYRRMVKIYGNSTTLVDFLADPDSNYEINVEQNTYQKAVWRFPTTTIHLTILAGPAFFVERKGWLYLRYFPTLTGPS